MSPLLKISHDEYIIVLSVKLIKSSLSFLLDDCKNINKFFKKRGTTVLKISQLFYFVILGQFDNILNNKEIFDFDIEKQVNND